MSSTPRCSTCGSPAAGQDLFCGSCGAPLTSGLSERLPPGEGEARAPEHALADMEVGAPDRESSQRASGGQSAPPGSAQADPGVDIFREAAPARPATGPVLRDPVPTVPPFATRNEPLGRSRDPLVGEAVPNATYLGQRLLYEKPPEASFDPLANTQYLLEAAKHALLFWIIWIVLGFITFIPTLLLSVATKSAGILAVWFIGGLIVGLALTLIWFFRPLPALLSEWKFAVDEKGPAGLTAFEHITWSFQQRETPVESVRVRRISQPGVPTRDYLEARDGVFTGYVSCFAYGNDLYIGWTFWLYLSPCRWMITALVRVWQTFTLRGSELYITLRYDTARAMREAMHSACREGVDVAAGQIAPRGQGIVGSDVAIDLTSLTTSN